MTVHTLGMSLRIVFILFAPCPEVTSILTEPIICSTHSFTEFVLGILHNGQYLMKMKIEKKKLNNSQFCKGSGKNIMMRCDVYIGSMPVLLLFDTVSRFSVCLHCRLASQTCTRPSSFNFWRWFQWQEKNVGIYIYINGLLPLVLVSNCISFWNGCACIECIGLKLITATCMREWFCLVVPWLGKRPRQSQINIYIIINIYIYIMYTKRLGKRGIVYYSYVRNMICGRSMVTVSLWCSIHLITRLCGAVNSTRNSWTMWFVELN